LLTLSDVVTRVNLSERTIRRHIARGELPAVRLGSRIRVDQEELDGGSLRGE
jgi:excisionase family DNA binding protein